MSDFLIAAGKRMHLIAESENGITATSPVAATNFPATHLHDGIQSIPFRHASSLGVNTVDADLNLAINGDFENWTGATPDAPTGWTLEGSTTVTKETTNPIEDVASVRVDGAIYRDFEVPVGTPIAFRCKMAEFGATTANATVQLIDMTRGRWLTVAGGWTGTLTNIFTESFEYSTANARTKGIVFTTVHYTDVSQDTILLRVRLLCGAENDGDEGIFDAVSLIVVPNFVSFHGHNLPGGKLGVSPKFDPIVKTSGASATGNQQEIARVVAIPFVTQDSVARGILSQPSFYYRLKDNCPFLDGTADAFELASPAAMSDSGLFTFSGWVRRDGQDSVDGYVLVLRDSGAGRRVLQIRCDLTNGITVDGRNSAGTTVLFHKTTAETLPPDTNWHHVLISVDLSQAVAAERSKIRIDGVDGGSASTVTLNESIDFSAVTKMAVGGNLSSDTVSPDLRAGVNELYFQPGFREDIDTQANREKFRIDSDGDRTPLGSDGSTPSGAQAYLYLRGTRTNPVTDFQSNFGSGGAFTSIGSPGSELMFGSQRFWRVSANQQRTSPAGDRVTPIEYGQWVLTRTQTLLKNQSLPYAQPRSRPHVEQRSPAGDIFRAQMSYADVVRFRFELENEAAERDLWLELRDRLGGGTRAVVIVPDTDRADVHFGFLSVDFPERRQFLDFFPVTVEFDELPFVESLVTE